MNAYFWFMAVWAFLITPVTLEVDVLFRQKMHWRIRVAMAGVPVFQKKQKKAIKTNRFPASRKGLLLALVRDKTLTEMLRAFRCRGMRIHARLSMADAARTAVWYSFFRTAAQVLGCCGVLSSAVSGRVEADFQAKGSCIRIQGIFSARLGTVIPAGIRLCISALRHQAELALEEKNNAASY